MLVLVAMPFALGFGVNVLFTADPEPWVRLPGGIGPGPHAAAEGVRLGLRAANLGAQALLVGWGLSASQSGEALSALLAPLERVVGPRIHTALFQLQITFRMGPILAREARRVRLAQELRGLSASGSVAAQVSALRPLFVPVLAASLLRSDRLALLLVARGYRPGAPRPYLPGARFGWTDRMVVGGAGLLSVWMLAR
jgi:energy-coupling factor transport system permease protein